MKNQSTLTTNEAEPILGQEGREIQQYGDLIPVPLGIGDSVRSNSVKQLNQLLAETMAIRDLYKKHHWQVSGATFYQLHLLFDKHYEEQATLVDSIAERIMMLGGISIAMATDVAEMSTIARPPRGREEPPVQVSRLIDAHAIILELARKLSDAADEGGDNGTVDLMDSKIIPTSEMQVWFVSQHVVDVPQVRANE